MTRLPKLERALLDAARRLETEQPGTPWWRRGTPLLAAGAIALAGGGGLAAASATGLLSGGDQVPETPKSEQPGTVKPGTIDVLALRVTDPDGGPPWGIGVYDLAPRPIAAAPSMPVGTPRCVRVGRVQNGILGVVGRDHLFNDYGRFHELSPFASATGVCQGTFRDGQLLMTKGGAPTPASGYSGDPTTLIGGCRSYGMPSRATSSPETRRKLRGIPRCAQNGERIVKYGFAGRQAKLVRFANGRLDLTAQPSPEGAYMFVIRPRDTGPKPMRITVTYRNGTTCKSPGRTALRVAKGPCNPPPGF